MIDFRATFDKDGLINFCNPYNETLKTYPMSDLKHYVENNELNKDILGVLEPITDYIDREWFEITEKFYNSINKTEHTAKDNYPYSKEANLK